MNNKKQERELVFTSHNTHICPKCGWESSFSGEGGGTGFTSTVEGAEGDWCLRCYVRKTTKGVPRMVKINK